MGADAKKIIPLYRRHALAWVKLRGSHFPERKWFEKFMSRLPQTPSILDVGCGSGEPIGRYILESGGRITGVDASPELIEIARKHLPEADWIVCDMRTLSIDAKFDGLLAWNSTFHLTPDDQRSMFPVFQQHAAFGAMLMFTSGPCHGEAIGEFQGEALYHSSLSGDEYRFLLDQHGFDVVNHVAENQDCGLQTIWLARFRSTT